MSESKIVWTYPGWNLRWHMIIYFILVHAGAILGIRHISLCQWQTLLWALLLYIWGGLSITGGAHRLWSHRSYKAHWILRMFYMFGFAFANEGPLYDWIRDHRIHHKFSETEADPHNVREGLLL